MDVEKVTYFINNSFLKELLIDKEITDISYNGESIYFVHNKYGRRISDINISENEVRDFIRQIANICEKQFSYQNPILDVSFGKYRFNAVHQSIGRVSDKQSVTFDVRIASSEPRINDDSDFLNEPLISLFKTLLDNKVSLVIGGVTGTGKTEFQKYLIRKMENYTRIIIIDNVLELDNVRNEQLIDITSWQVDENNNKIDIQHLVRNALRSNPDWIVVAESRGAEMIEILNSALTGHPIITTIHAFDGISMPTRMVRMIMMNDKKMDYKDVIKDIYYHFHFFIYLKIKINDDGSIKRFIDSVVEYNSAGKYHFVVKKNDEGYRYEKMYSETLNLLDLRSADQTFLEIFGEASL